MALWRKRQMEIIKLNINEVIPYPDNPRKNDNAVDAVAESIKQCGYCSPIVIDEDNVILAGHTRLKALKKLKWKEVECVRKTGLTEEQKKKYRILDNKTNELAEWDFDLLEEEIADLDFDGFDFGFDFNSGEDDAEIIEDEVPEVNEEIEPTVKLGDIWQLGRHRLMCGDSTNADEVSKLTDGTIVDLLLTDPPYNVNYTGGTEDELKIQNDNMESEQFKQFLTDAFTAGVSCLKDGGSFYIWFASREHCNFENALNASGLSVRQELIWKKNALVLGRQDYQWKHEPCLYGWKDGASHNWYGDRSQTTILEFDKPTRSADHPTMKPVELFAYQIKNSTKKGETVLDLFGGSGTTIIACEQTGRTAYCMELDERYCDVIIKRYENLTGDTAVKIN